ncbi:NAD(P)/FAD-dependent oxidoreductase [Micromonospora sp. NPDC050200]|uniref:flavin-containing monooxygenase n=1 Tax=Micromonospora sp. NPDC050200 TaxID=3155664 RepID=UPI00340CF21E
MTDQRPPASAADPDRRYDALVVGAGFAGMYMLHRLRERGFRAHVFEAAENVGGVWYWNRYPGARCDVPSLAYSYSFSEELQQEWEWTERYAAQPEILRYAEHVADRFDLRRDITFGTRVTSAVFDERTASWIITTDSGARVSARYFIPAVGCLSAVRTPDLPGAESFRGETYHTGNWPHTPVDFAGKRVGVIGTGSSGIQAIPLIAEVAERVVVFQRTPNFSLPARNRPLTAEEVRETRSRYAQIRADMRRTPAGALHPSTGKGVLEVSEQERQAEFERRWEVGGTGFMAAFTDILRNADANRAVADFVHGKIRQIVRDPEVASRLCPTDHPIGAKRICADTDYYQTYNRANVELVDVRATPVTGLTADGLRTSDAEYELDIIVYATGYDAMTGSLTRMDICGPDGTSLAEAWRDGPRTYLGLAVAGFPNLFVVAGPGSPSVLVNCIMAAEQHVEWISDVLEHLRASGADRIEAERAAQDEWVSHVNEVADRTLYPQANSWYTGANIPGKPRVFMPYVGGLNAYRDRCDEVAAAGYHGFRTTAGAADPDGKEAACSPA